LMMAMRVIRMKMANTAAWVIAKGGMSRGDLSR
jgi:hypothetical protein